VSTLGIRRFEADDEAAVGALWQRCGLTRPWNDPSKDIARKLGVQRELFLVGAENGRIVAAVMAGYDGHRGSVNYLAVDPQCRRRGYGAAMMRRVEEMLAERGCPKINLMVRSSSAEVTAFYGRLGYAADEVVVLGKRLIPD
jgi:ribosomal protein S18 acetylase RimI-like enzyme